MPDDTNSPENLKWSIYAQHVARHLMETHGVTEAVARGHVIGRTEAARKALKDVSKKPLVWQEWTVSSDFNDGYSKGLRDAAAAARRMQRSDDYGVADTIRERIEELIPPKQDDLVAELRTALSNLSLCVAGMDRATFDADFEAAQAAAIGILERLNK